jgi:hypothetical protein
MIGTDARATGATRLDQSADAGTDAIAASDDDDDHHHQHGRRRRVEHHHLRPAFDHHRALWFAIRSHCHARLSRTGNQYASIVFFCVIVLLIETLL